MYKLVLILLFRQLVPEVSGQTARPYHKLPPHGNLQWPKWVNNQLPGVRVTNLTKEILADITLKLEHCKTIQELYRYSQGYEIGTIAAAIKDTFENMLQIYRNYAAEEVMINPNVTTGGISQYVRAYAVIQGEYNSIRLERNLFLQTRKKFAEMNVAQDDRLAALGLTAQQRQVLNELMNKKQIGRRTADTDMLLNETYWNSDRQDILQTETEDQADEGRSIALQKPAKKVLWKHKDDTEKVMNLDQFD